LLASILAGSKTMTPRTTKGNETGADEAALIRKIVGGQRDLFGDLIAPHLTPLLRIVRATIGGDPEVEDIVQQTALKAFTHLAQFRFEAGFSTWLIQIGLNEARQWRRKCASSRIVDLAPLSLSELPIADRNHSPLSECQRRETGAQLRAALVRLPEKYRNVILLRDIEDLSVSEVAGRLGLTIPAVKTRHRRARQKVAGFLERSKKFRPRSRGPERAVAWQLKDTCLEPE
jgi:RNA polymerase sigma-70 factor (ECF subfamily)